MSGEGGARKGTGGALLYTHDNGGETGAKKQRHQQAPKDSKTDSNSAARKRSDTSLPLG